MMNGTKTHTIKGSPAGKYARTRAPGKNTMEFEGNTTIEPAKMTTSQLFAVGKIAISGTTEVSPIVEVLNMADYTDNVVSVVPVTEPIFQASPSSITIRDFRPLETLQVKISMRNNDNVARRVKIVQPESTFFSVELVGQKPSSKVAPGMDVNYVLKFTPEERTDYFCDLICFTEREKFIIPVRALGPRGWLDFPDQVVFEEAPVKSESVKTVLVRNVGDSPCTFTITSTLPFAADPPTAILQVDQSIQIHFSFFPETTEECTGEFLVEYGTGESVVIGARGVASELAVRLDSHAMLMDPTYVTLFSQKSFKIINRSENTLSYCFKQFASAAEEIKARMRFGTIAEASIEEGQEVEYDDSFHNDSFQLSPSQGEVWPNSEVEVVVTFTPATATEIACVAFCDIAGKENRFPLHLQGTGIGAKIVLSYTVIDIGEVFINSVSEYDVELDNQGEIGAHYELLPSDSLFGSKFSFTPSAGTLGVGQKEAIKVSFSSDVLGEFSEDFGWSLQGTPKPLTLTIRGKVIGPTFHLDESSLDFQRVSVAFLNSKHFHLFNTADIPFRFHMRVPADGAGLKREFEVVPTTGTILPHGKQKIRVDFIPLSTRAYNLNLVMDIESVGEEMASVAIKGQAIVPEVTVSTTELHFGECFLRYPYKKVIELVNHSDLPAKFELLPQDEVSRCVATYEVDYPEGTIEAFQQRVITVSFTTERLEKVQLPMFFRVVGHDDEPLEIQCIAVGIGPRLSLHPTQIKWGDIEVLQDVERTLKVKNESLIPAYFQTLVMKRASRFRVNVEEFTLGAGETCNLKLTANVDDTIAFKDDLCLVVTEGGELKVPLNAKGIGTTICADGYAMGAEPKVELGFQFTSRLARKTIVITNRGPKQQTLSWFNGTALAAQGAKQADPKEGTKKKVAEETASGAETFRVEINGSTEPYLIEPGASATVAIIGYSRKAGSITEKLCCRSKIDKNQAVIIEMNVTADFVDPAVEFSSPTLDFEYNYDPAVPLEINAYTKTAIVRNACPLPLQCAVKCSGAPFLVEPSDIDLQVGESATLQVHFDPSYRGDSVSEVVKQSITLSYNMGPGCEPKNERAAMGVHPRKGTIELNGQINYPNLKIDKSEVKFGAVLNDTTRRMKVKCTNCSNIDASFSWYFVVSENETRKRPGSSGTTVQSSRMDPPHPINAVFDILPIRSYLKPGQSEDVEFVFYGHANHKYRAVAMCEVLGGPEYEVKLEGEASSIQYKFDRTSIDFGNAIYDKFASEDLVLYNTGKVRLDFTVRTDAVPAPTLIKAVPQTSFVAPGDKVKIQMQIYPGVPTFVTTAVSVEVAHFEPQSVIITGKGIFPHLAIALPRVDPDRFARLLVEAQDVMGLASQTGGYDTSRTEGMPGVTARTGGTDVTEAMRAGGMSESSAVPTRRNTAVRPPSMSMETYLQTNPFVRQLQAEADCLGMREYILERVRAKEEEEDAARGKVFFDEEAERQQLALLLDGDEARDGATTPGTRPGTSTPKVQLTAPPGPGAGEAVRAMGSEDKKAEPIIDMRQYVLAEYVCDFGHVVKGQQLQREFPVRNVGFSQVSFEFPKQLKSAITNAGFIVEPDRVQRLPGAPDFESVEFSVIFNSNRPGIPLGEINLELPVQIRGGPQITIVLKANVTIPDVELSTESLKFGSVFCGQCRTITVQLRNRKEIPANWSFAQALSVEKGGQPKPCHDFTVIPAKGSLNPGESCNVQVVFHPAHPKQFTVKLPLKIAQNSVSKRSIRVVAQSENMFLRFDPPQLELNPILPYVTETECKVLVHNDTDAQMEFFSTDFDHQFLEEEAILRRVDAVYQPEGLVYRELALLPLRAAGSGLQAPVMEAWAPIAEAEEAERQARAAEEERRAREAEGGGEGEEGGEEEKPAEEGEAGEGGEGGAVGPEGAETLGVEDGIGRLLPLEDVEEDVRSVLVYGHPLAKTEGVSRRLARKYRIGTIQLKAMLEEYMRRAGIVQYMEPEEEPEEDAEEGAEPKMVAVPNKFQLDAEASPAGAVKDLQEAVFPPLPPPEEGEEGEAPPEPAAGDGEEGEEGEEQGPPPPRVEEVEEGWFTAELLEKLIKDHLLGLQFIRGVVFDGLDLGAFLPHAEVAKAVQKALSARDLYVVVVDHEAAPEPEVVEGEEGEGEGADGEPENAGEGPEGGEEGAEKAEEAAEGEEEEEEKEHMQEEGQSMERSRITEEGEEMEDVDADAEMDMDAEAAAPEEEEEEELPEPVISEESMEEVMEKYNADLEAVLQLLDPPPPEEGEEGEEAPADGEEDGEKAPEGPPPAKINMVKVKRVGTQPVAEVAMEALARMPEPAPLPGEARQLKIPPSVDQEVVVRPAPRPERRPVTNFYILTPHYKELTGEEEEEEEGEDGEAPEGTIIEVDVEDDEEEAVEGGEGGEEGGEEGAEGAEEEGGEAVEKPKKKRRYRLTYTKQTRWVVEPHSSQELLVRMHAEDTGRCEATLGFEIMGGGVVMRGRQFGLPVRGTCAYPQISQNYQSLYYRKMKTRGENQIVSKQYIISKNVFEFGPLLVGKEREDFKEKYPENQEKFRITNSGLFDMHVEFCFKDDQEGKTFMVEPEELDLAVDDTQDITVYAFTEEEGEVFDSLVCNIKDNPEPVEINVSCIGSVPTIVTDIEKEVDDEGEEVEGPLKVEFQRLLLKRKDTRVVTIKNTSLLPAKWSLQGCTEEDGFNCGKEFTISPTEGTLFPGQTEEILIGFHAIEKEVFEKPLVLEWIDMDEILPEKKSLEFVVTAEAYEIDFTFTFPTGDGIDFGVVKVAEGAEREFTITNSGKYKVGYKFAFARPKRSIAAKYFAIESMDEGDNQGLPHGELEPDEGTANIKVRFDSRPFAGFEEVDFKDNTELKCYVSELLTGEEIFATPIKINVRSVFSKYRVLPQRGINFGALTYDTSKTRTFDIVNQGEFEFNFDISCITTSSNVKSRPGTAAQSRSTQEGEPTGDGGVKFGNFSVKPQSGQVAPNGEKATVTVDFAAEGQSQFFEVLGVAISERDPAQDVDGLPYELSGESCVPGLLNDDFLQIFEEAAVARKPPSDPNELIRNTFIEEERAYHFGPRLVGSRAETRIKVINPTKVPVTVQLKMLPKGDSPLAFSILEESLQLPMHEHRYATVYFEPTSLENFVGTFEATVDLGTDEKTNKLLFDVRGEGTLPRVTVLEPSARNAAGQALMSFNKLLKNKSQSMPFRIANKGIMPATVRFGRIGAWPAPAEGEERTDGPSCFNFSGRGGEIFLNQNEEKSFEMIFNPKEVGTFQGSLEMVVQQNDFERNIIELSGEGFEQDLSFDNMPNSADDELKFGDLPVGVQKQLTFSFSNNSTSTIYRFEWNNEDLPEISFSPSVGHLQPGASKNIVATIMAKAPMSRDGLPVTAKVWPITYPEGSKDWDDSMKDIEWVVDGEGDQTTDTSLLQHQPSLTQMPSADNLLDQSLAPSFVDVTGGSPQRRGRKKPKKVTKVRPEPPVNYELEGDPPEEGEEDEREKKSEEMICKVSVEAAFVKYAFLVPDEEGEEGETKEVETLPDLTFAETMMYRERVHRFTLKNTSQTRFDYAWRMCHADGTEDTASDAPFTVEPSRGALLAGAAVDITVKFAPTEVDSYARTLQGEVAHLDTRIAIPPPPEPAEGEEEEAPAAEEEDEEKPPEPQPQPLLRLAGRSVRPLCHIELEDSDWLTGGRRPPTLETPGGGTVDPNSRCLEFESLGTNVRNTRRFFVMNPTNISYKYRWECDDGTGAAVAHLASAFKCVHKEGVVLSGKKAEMVFEYTPESDKLLESVWTFHIPEHKLSVPFLLVGHVKEPRVAFDKTYCNFNSLLLHRAGTQTVKLINREHIPFAFSFDRTTYGADENPPVCSIIPSQGTVGPESELELKVQFKPKVEKFYNFNAVCNVKKKATRLALNIKGEGFDNHTSVAVEEERGSVQVQPSVLTPIDFGEVHVNETRIKQVVIANTGKYPVEFEWKSPKSRQFTIKPEKMVIPKGEKVDVHLAFHPTSEAHLADHAATLTIINGPKYNFLVSASGRRPLLHFSFQKMDFGPCFLYRQGAEPNVAVLRLTNEDSHDIGFNALFENKPYLEIDSSPTNLAPGESEEIRITFMPRELKEYREDVQFEINGLYRVTVELRGSGHDCDVALANLSQFNFNFGAVKVGTVVDRRVKVKNNSAVVANCSILQSVMRLENWDLHIRPTEFLLKPRDSIDLEVSYSPSNRMLPFTEDLKVEVAGITRTLMVVNGSAVGVELKLETDMVFFGAVVANSRTVRRVQLENIGDIGTKWRWAADGFGPEFSVSPTEGFLNPHDEASIEIFFHPSHVSDDLRRDNIPLFVEGADPLFLTITGICVSQEPREETISYDTSVRVPVTQKIPPIKNPTDAVWRLVPVIDNEYWSGPDIVEIPPGQEVGCQLTYRPLAMTITPEDEAEEAAAAAAAEDDEKPEGAPAQPNKYKRPKQHNGSVFIPLPDGTAVMYNLVGTAGKPNREGERIARELQSKASHTELIPVSNWLSRSPQRFTVKIDPPPEGTTTLKGASYIDVPPNAERSYALKFHTYVEGVTEATLTLTNEATGEYVFYDLAFTATACPVLQEYDLSTVVRQSKELEIDLANPLSEAVTMTAACDTHDIVLQPSYELLPLRETPCRVIFRPLLETTETAVATVTFSSSELGDFVYQLKLNASAPGADRSIQFKAPLGSVAVQTFRFMHYLPSASSYECSTDNPVFTVRSGASVSAPAAEDAEKGVEVEVEVAFEPDVIGESTAKLAVKSDDGGEYVCILNGYGQPPTPQGPFEVSGSYKIDFKNPFSTPKSFTVAVDNEAFTVGNRLDDVAPRSSIPINVAYRSGGGSGTKAKLTVVCESLPPWIYYLDGV